MRFVPSPKAAAVLHAQVRPHLTVVAEAISDAVVAQAPNGARTVGFRESIRTREHADSVTVGSVDNNAHIVEFGSRTSPEYAPMRSAIADLGLHLNQLGKSRGASGRTRGGSGRA